MTQMCLVLALALYGCITTPDTRVCVSADPTIEAAAVDAANAWVELGFVAVGGACGEADLHIDLEVQDLSTLGVSGLSDRATGHIIVDSHLKGWGFASIVAHEVGHILLKTGRHVDSGDRAIMNAQTATWDVQPADWALACDTIGRCL